MVDPALGGGKCTVAVDSPRLGGCFFRWDVGMMLYAFVFSGWDVVVFQGRDANV